MTLLTAKTADIFALYEESVQSPDEEVAFIRRTFKKHYARDPLRLREDFCGSAALCAAWVRSDPRRRALGIDLDPRVLAWGETHHRAPFPREAQRRFTMHRGDVLSPPAWRSDCVVAYNYSWWVFKRYETLRAYFRTVRESLPRHGLFFLDVFGGTLAEQVSLEPRRYRRFTYVWEQASFNPIDGHFTAHIHFEFKDGSRIDRAFTYDWRMWRLPETIEALREAGFSEVDVYWEKADARGKPSGVFRVRRVAENEPSWNAYVVARTSP